MVRSESVQQPAGFLVATMLAGLLVTGVGRSDESATRQRERIVFANRGELFAVDPNGKGLARLTRSAATDSHPVVSPDGRRIAFVSDRDGNDEIYVVTNGDDVTRLTSNPGRIDTTPAWSPDGKRIAWASGLPGELDLYVMNADGSGKQALVTSPGDDAEPAWSPGGKQIAFASNREGNYDVWIAEVTGGERQQLTDVPADDREPAWSPEGTRLAFVSNRDGNEEIYTLNRSGLDLTRLTVDPAPDRHPTWAPDAGRIAFARANSIFLMAADGSAQTRLTSGAGPDWGELAVAAPVAAPVPPKPQTTELLPDLDQRAPHGLTVSLVRGRFRLGFASAVDNVGLGPLWVRSSRPSTLQPTMTARQLIRLSNGKLRVVPRVGVVRYTYSASHSHWHLLRFESYELRRAGDFELIVRDSKSGFCLADHYGHAARRVRGFGPPVFLSNCGKGRLDLLSVDQGSSIGYTDRYPAHYHGQNVDVTGVRAGRYVLVHRANPRGLLREVGYANNAASLLLHLSWPAGRKNLPRVRVLRVCEDRDRCQPPRGSSRAA